MQLRTYSAAVVLATAASLPPGSSLAAQTATSPPAAPQAAPQAARRGALQGLRHVARPLEPLAAEHILVLPLQYLVFGDSLGWSAQVRSPRDYMSSVDDEIAFALRERGLDGRWTLAPAIVASAQRNAGFSADPHAIDARELRPGAKLDEWQLQEPLASQLRSLIALTDARYVLFPVELRTSNAPGGARALLHVVVVDARRSQVQWSGDVGIAPSATMSPAIAARLASALADLVAAPAE